jgi:hypothetical protein
VHRSPWVATAMDDGGWPRGERVSAQCPAHQVHGAGCGDQSAALGTVGRQHSLQAAPRKLGPELGPGRPVALARPLDAAGQVMPGQFREGQRVSSQHAV